MSYFHSHTSACHSLLLFYLLSHHEASRNAAIYSHPINNNEDYHYSDAQYVMSSPCDTPQTMSPGDTPHIMSPGDTTQQVMPPRYAPQYNSTNSLTSSSLSLYSKASSVESREYEIYQVEVDQLSNDDVGCPGNIFLFFSVVQVMSSSFPGLFKSGLVILVLLFCLFFCFVLSL